MASKYLTVDEAIAKINNAIAGSTIYISISSENEASADLISALGFTGTKILDGTYKTVNGESNPIIVNVKVVSKWDILIKVETSADDMDVHLFTDTWLWELEDGISDGTICFDIENTTTYNTISSTASTEEFKTAMSHTYAAEGSYTIGIKGIRFKGFSEQKDSTTDEYIGGDKIITEIQFIEDQIITNPQYLFCKMSNLVKISGKIKVSDTRTSGGFNYVFQGCTKLEDISDLTIIFNNLPENTRPTLNATFDGCEKLTDKTLNEFKLLNWNKNRCFSHWHTFMGCSSLTNIPLDFISEKPAKYDSTFKGTSISFLPNVMTEMVSEESAPTWSTFDGVNTLKYVAKQDTWNNVKGSYLTFSNTCLCYKAVENIYNALIPKPDDASFDTADQPKSWTMWLSYDETEPYIVERLQKLLNINPETYPQTGLPMSQQGQYDTNNDKGWKITFTSQSFPF